MKRIFDIVLSASLLIALSPLIVLLLGLVSLKLGWPPLFRQQRIGVNGDLFVLSKFRSMTDARNSGGELLPDSKRLTNFGKLLRQSSLDELPSLWNVLLGDMAMVGPRPLLPEYLALYSDEQARRHDIKPGLTGWAQINGRNSNSWKKKFELDVWYVDNYSLWLDVKILFKTFSKVLGRDGINEQGSESVTKFRGNECE